MNPVPPCVYRALSGTCCPFTQRLPDGGRRGQPEGAPMSTSRDHWLSRLSQRRIRPWLAATACAIMLATLVTFRTSLPEAQAQPITRAPAAATGSAPVPDVGVQDSWINSCDTGSTPNYAPKGADPSVPAVDSPYWPALDMNTVRFSPPGDIAYHTPGYHL